MLLDNSPLAYNNAITDWELGDDRIFTRSVAAASLPATDVLTNAYLTIKSSPTELDALSVLQKHITTALTTAGQITGSPELNMLFNVFSADYEGLVTASTVYYYDIRVVTNLGHTYTVETGTISWQQNVTQTNVAGTPAVLPNNGQPRFQGFSATRPDLVPNNQGLFNAGDFMFNLNPLNGNGHLWQCTISGSPGTWITVV